MAWKTYLVECHEKATPYFIKISEVDARTADEARSLALEDYQDPVVYADETWIAGKVTKKNFDAVPPTV